MNERYGLYPRVSWQMQEAVALPMRPEGVLAALDQDCVVVVYVQADALVDDAPGLHEGQQPAYARLAVAVFTRRTWSVRTGMRGRERLSAVRSLQSCDVCQQLTASRRCTCAGTTEYLEIRVA